MTELELKAKAIATALKGTSMKRISQDAANAALKVVLADCPIEHVPAVATTFMNLSALNQELERHALITTERSMPALLIEVKKQLATPPSA